MRFLIYCSPAFAFAIPTFPVMILLPALYAEKYSLSIASVGVAIFLGKLIDIISDPLMGWITDKGFMKRKSLILIGSIISGLALYLLFVPISAFHYYSTSRNKKLEEEIDHNEDVL